MLDWFINFADKYLVEFAVHLVLAALELFIGLKIVKFLTTRLEKKRSILRLDNNVGSLILSAAKILLNSAVIIIAVQILGVPSATIVAAIGSCGLAIGLALQGGLSNLAGGVMILILQPFQCKDYIKTTAGEGTVEDIGLFYTRLETVDKQLINIPNSLLSSTTVVNYFAKPTRGIDVEVSVAYGTDIDNARNALLKCVESCPTVLKDPPPKVFVSAHGDSAVKLILRIAANSTDYWATKNQIMESTLKALPDAGIEIPFPQIDVHMK